MACTKSKSKSKKEEFKGLYKIKNYKEAKIMKYLQWLKNTSDIIENESRVWMINFKIEIKDT